MGKHRADNDKILLKEIFRELDKIKTELETLKEKSMHYHINIEKLDIQELKSLEFHLDKLDIEELSGSLNLGNNFGLKPEECIRPGKKKKRRAGYGYTGFPPEKSKGD